MRVRGLAHDIRVHQDQRYARRAKEAVAFVTGTNQDGALRNVSASVTVDGLENQTMAISYGTPVYAGETWLVRNDGSATLPRWNSIRRLSGANATPDMDRPTLPTPTGLLLETQSYSETPLGGSQRAWVYAYWYIIGEQFGPMNYEVQYATNDPGEPTTVIARDDEPNAVCGIAVDDSQVIIPRAKVVIGGALFDFPRRGRIKIEAELIDYTTVSGAGGYGGTGVGDLNTLTDVAATWDVNEYTNYLLRDAVDNLYLVLANTATILSVSGTPASGAYSLYPCFSGCTRGASGTDAAAHDGGTGIDRLSCGIQIPHLFVDTDYNVRIRAVRDDGAISAWTDWVSITTGLDSTAPAAPTDFTAVSQVGGVWFQWSNPLASDEPDLAGFNIYEALDASGTGANLLTFLPVVYGHFYALPVGYNFWYNIKSRDHAGNLSDYGEAVWVNAISLGGGGKNLLSNSDFERDFDSDDWPDDWYEDSSRVDWGDYGRLDSKGIRFTFSGKYQERLCYWPYPYTDIKVQCVVGEWYTMSVYFWTDEDEALIKYDGADNDGYLSLTCRIGFTDEAGAGGFDWSGDFDNVEVIHLGNGWRRVCNSHMVTEDDLSLWNREFVLGRFGVRNMINGAEIVYADRAQLERTRYPSEWSSGLTPPDGWAGGKSGLLLDLRGIISSDDPRVFALTGDGKMATGLHMLGLDADPVDPGDSEAVIWASDGTDAGDDGDIMATSQDSGGTPVTVTLMDHSLGGPPQGDTQFSITVASPGAAEDIAIGFTFVAITVTEVQVVIKGTSCTIDPYHNTDRSGGGGATDILAGPTAITNTTTGQNITSFNDDTIPADSWIVFVTTAVTACTEITLTINYTVD